MTVAIERRGFLLGGLAIPIVSQFGLAGSLFAQTVGPDAADIQSIETRLRESFKNAAVLFVRDAPVDAALVAQGRPVVVFGQRLRLDGTYHTNGHPLALIAREIEVAPGASIVTAGRMGENGVPNARAADGRDPGTNGENGVLGGAGSHGGDALILCREINGNLSFDLSGGAGGPGQSGGNGRNGANGGNGSNDRCTRGKAGGKGGDAGAGADGGTGGNGGTALIQTVKPVTPGQIVFAHGGGIGGKPGKHGTPGDGGSGGVGYERVANDRGGGGPPGGGGPNH